MTIGRRRRIIGSTIAAGVALLLYFVPLFRIVPLSMKGESRLDGSSQAASSGNVPAFEPVAFVDKFWRERLLPNAGGAVDALTLVTAIEQDPKAAKKSFGRSVSVGSVYFYFLQGTGRVVSVEKNSIGLSIQDGQRRVQVLLEAGNIFGNAVRDGTGLLDVNDFANSQNFNAISSEINRRIESDVLPSLREKSTMGAEIRFVGCAEVTNEPTDLNPLRVVPFIVEAP